MLTNSGIFPAILLATLLLTLVRLEEMSLNSGGDITMEATTYATHDDMPNIFAGVGILPIQYGESRRRKLPAEGERKLLFAVLEDAIRTYLRHRDKGVEARNNEDFVEAAAWLSSDEEDGPFAFVNVCEALGIEADCLRAGISNHTGRLEEIRT
jgi:hypothetical protein